MSIGRRRSKKLLKSDWRAATAAYFSLRGLKVSEFLNMPKMEQLFYHAVKEAEEERRHKELKTIIEVIAKIHGAKVR